MRDRSALFPASSCEPTIITCFQLKSAPSCSSFHLHTQGAFQFPLLLERFSPSSPRPPPPSGEPTRMNGKQLTDTFHKDQPSKTQDHRGVALEGQMQNI